MSKVNRIDDWLDDTSINVLTSPQFIATREQVMRQMRKAKRTGITYGLLSRRISQDGRQILSAVISDLVSDGLVQWDPNEPAPSRVYLR